jgi:peroxiredoxin
LDLTFDLTYLALWGLVVFQTLVLLGLLRESVETRRQIAELSAGGPLAGRLELGTKAPDFTAVEARGGGTVRRGSLAGRRSIVLFLSPSCRNCEQLAAGVHGIYHKAEGNLVLVCQGARAECLAFLDAQGVRQDVPVLLDPEREIASRFRVLGVPAAVMLDEELRIRAYGSPKGPDDLAAMVDQAGAPDHPAQLTPDLTEMAREAGGERPPGDQEEPARQPAAAAGGPAMAGRRASEVGSAAAAASR